jgi:hypothetical protein
MNRSKSKVGGYGKLFESLFNFEGPRQPDAAAAKCCGSQMLRDTPPERSGEETGRAWRERRKKLPKGCKRNLHSWEEARKTGNSGKDFMATWGYSSAGRAPALQAGGQRFDPVYLHQQPDAAAAKCCATPRRRDPGRKRAEHGGRVGRRFRKTKQQKAEKWLQEAEYAAE